jgi:hypothetical protein
MASIQHTNARVRSSLVANFVIGPIPRLEDPAFWVWC